MAANRILANEGVLDAYGHISIRHRHEPESFFLSRSRSPQLVIPADIMEFGLDGESVKDGETRPAYLERYIHSAIYAARPDVQCVIHGHTEALLPFGISGVPLVPVIHSASEMDTQIPVWDIRRKFGDATDLLVSNTEQGRDLAATLDTNSVALMRGHGFASCGSSTIRVVGMTIYLARNARVLTSAYQLGGGFVPLSEGEITARHSGDPGTAFDPDSPAVRRGWEYWARRAGCEDLLDGLAW